MKKLTIFVTLYLISSIVFSQKEFKSVDSLLLKDLSDQVKQLKEMNQQNVQIISQLSAGSQLQSKNRYLIIKSNIVEAAKTLKLLNAKLGVIESTAHLSLLNTSVNDITNPESKDLGFSFSEKVIELVNTHINPRKKNLAAKITEAVEAVTKSPLVDDIPQIAPAISISNSIVSILRSTGIASDQIDQEKISKFEAELSRYTKFYIKLNNANQSFKYNTTKRIEDALLLKQQLADLLNTYCKHLTYTNGIKGKNETAPEYCNRTLISFDDFIDSTFQKIEKANTKNGSISYDDILKSNPELLKVNNSLEEIINLCNLFEFQHDGSIKEISQFSNEVASVLDYAKKNGIGISLNIEKKLGEIKTFSSNSITAFQSAVLLPELIDSKKNIKYLAFIY